LPKYSRRYSYSLPPHCFGFYDWFCRDYSLRGKAKKLYSVARSIGKVTKRFDIDRTYVFFKNNCPCCGGLYDDLRICDIESGNVIYNVKPPRSGEDGEVYGEENGFEEPLAKGSMKDIRMFFASTENVSCEKTENMN